jgi:hypothetical protein
MKQPTNCFLTTCGEYSELTEPRACHTLDRLKDQNHNDYMLVEIDPPLSGRTFGLGSQDIRHLLLSTTLANKSLFPITEWPAYVYVTRMLDESVLTNLEFTAQQVELIARGFLYPSLDEAAAAAARKF